MGNIVGAALVSHHPGLMQCEDFRKMQGAGEDSTLIAGYARLRDKISAVRADVVVIFDSHWFTTGYHLVDGGKRFEGHIFHTPEERALVSRLTSAGLVDLFRHKFPDTPGFTWWDYRAGSFHKNEGMRLDFLLATPSLAERVTDIYVDREYRKKGKVSGAVPSDHAPVIATLA